MASSNQKRRGKAMNVLRTGPAPFFERDQPPACDTSTVADMCGVVSVETPFATVEVVVACRKQSPAQTPSMSGTADSVLVFVRVPEKLQPLDRAAKYEEPLDAALKKAGIGEVTGGGSQLSAPKPDGSRDIQWVGIDVELLDLDRGIGPLKQELIRLGVPQGTLLEYQRSGKHFEDPVH